MIPAETGISLPRAFSVPSSTASLCARILLPTGELLLALSEKSAEPAIASAPRSASGSRRKAAFFIVLPFLADPRRPWLRGIYERPPIRDRTLSFLGNPQKRKYTRAHRRKE